MNSLLETDGVDVNSTDKSGRTPLSYAVEEGHERGCAETSKHECQGRVARLQWHDGSTLGSQNWPRVHGAAVAKGGGQYRSYGRLRQNSLNLPLLKVDESLHCSCY